jgi:hypothetical protein
MHTIATILAAAEKSASEEVPYFVAGGLFALWAVVVSLIGLRNPDFPKSGGAGRVTIGISSVLAAATVGLLIAVSV